VRADPCSQGEAWEARPTLRQGPPRTKDKPRPAPAKASSTLNPTSQWRECSHLALLLGAGLFDGPKLEHGGAPPLLIVHEHMFAAVSRLAHKPHSFLAELIAAHREIIAVPERAPIRACGAAAECEANRDQSKPATHHPPESILVRAGTLEVEWGFHMARMLALDISDRTQRTHTMTAIAADLYEPRLRWATRSR